MADLTEIQSSQSVKVAGANPTTGAEDSYLDVDTSGRITVKLNDSAGSAITNGQTTLAYSLPVAIASDQTLPLPTGAATAANQTTQITSLQLIDNPIGSPSGGTAGTSSFLAGGIYNSTAPALTNGQQASLQVDSSGALIIAGVTSITSPLPAATITNQESINTGVTAYTSYTATQRLAVKQFYAGGTGIGKQVLYRSVPSSTQFVTSGDFETAGDISAWPYYSAGGGGTGVSALSTAQFYTGTHSVSITFTSSDSNHSNGVKQTFSSPVDYSAWRYISTQFYNTVSVGAAYTRTISIVLTDSVGATRTYSVSGLSTSAPFNASGWIQILGDQQNPTSSTGTGFDQTSIASVELRMFDSGNKAGTIYWDTVQLQGALTSVFPIYHLGNVTFTVNIDPVFIMNIGDQIIIAQTNNDSSRKEYYALVGAISI